MAGDLTNDEVRLTLPLKPEYLPVLRATVGVIAGAMTFNYDEIMQLRVAVSEVFDLAMMQLTGQKSTPDVNELNVRFLAGRGRLEIEMAPATQGDHSIDMSDREESQALLDNLLDRAEPCLNNTGVRMIKYTVAQG